MFQLFKHALKSSLCTVKSLSYLICITSARHSVVGTSAALTARYCGNRANELIPQDNASKPYGYTVYGKNSFVNMLERT